MEESVFCHLNRNTYYIKPIAPYFCAELTMEIDTIILTKTWPYVIKCILLLMTHNSKTIHLFMAML